MFRPAPVLAASLLVAASCGGNPAPATQGPPPGPVSALLLTLDTTRADALGAYGQDPAVTPNLDRLAAEGLTFTRAHTVAPLTLPAHSSMMTGLYPPGHTVRENGLWPLPTSAETLAERAQASGFATGAFVAAVVLAPTFGLDQGFDVYQGPARPKGSASSHYNELPAPTVVDAALAWLAELPPERPYFLWVHLFEPHSPYEPPPDFRGGVLAGRPYLGEVSFMDQEIGRLVEGLSSLGRLEGTALLAVADHGESLGEHGELSHAVFCYQPTLNVPLVLRYPDGWRAGERSDALVSVADAAPTLAAAMGLDFPEVDGRSLYHADPPPDRGVYFESYSGYLSFGTSPLAGWIDARGKYLHSSAPEFFDPWSDPGESDNLFATRPDETEPYRNAIAEVAARTPLAPDLSPTLDPDLIDDIRSLGYTAAGAGEQLPHPLEPSERPSPREEAERYEETLVALAHLNAGNLAEAERRLREVLAGNPHNHVAGDKLATALMRQERYGEALPILMRLVQGHPASAAGHLNLGSCLRFTGDTDGALASYWRAVELDPQYAFMDELMQLLRDTGRLDEAGPYLERYAALREARGLPR